MKITFLGAAGEVTGSQHLIETDSHRILLDCGLFQGGRAQSYAKNSVFHCQPKNLDGIFLSHAHIDHCGNLPGIYRAGFRGPIYSTAATVDIAEVMLRDSAHIQEEDARYMERRVGKDAPPITPLYTEEDVREVVKLFEPLQEGEWHSLSKKLAVRFADAGHILGSSIVELKVEDDRLPKRIVYSGDLGQRGIPILKDPTVVDGCDVLICESTYGDRIHPPMSDLKRELLSVLRRAEDLGGKVIIPAFSLGRTQLVVYVMNELFHSEELPRLPIYVDSPLATRLTNLYRDYPLHFDVVATQMLETDDDLFSFDSLRYIQSRQESMSLNDKEGPYVVISASGMCESGRVRHHLKHAVADPKNIVCLIGYQAPGTLGRRIEERQARVRILGDEVPLRCEVTKLVGFSAHGDVEDMRWWIRGISSRGGIGQCFLVHGEPDVARQFAEVIRDECNEDPIVPRFRESFEL